MILMIGGSVATIYFVYTSNRKAKPQIHVETSGMLLKGGLDLRRAFLSFRNLDKPSAGWMPSPNLP